MNLMTVALSLALAAGGIVGATKAATLLAERVQRQAAAGDAMIELAKRGAAPAPSAEQLASDAQLRQRSVDELAALIELAR